MCKNTFAICCICPLTAQKVKFSIKDFFSKCDEIYSFLRICSYLLKQYLMENFIFCAMSWCCLTGVQKLQCITWSFVFVLYRWKGHVNWKCMEILMYFVGNRLQWCYQINLSHYCLIMWHKLWFLICKSQDKWIQVFKSGPSKICGIKIFEEIWHA